MKKQIITLTTALIVTISALGQQKYDCKVKLKPLPQPAKAYLVSSFGWNNKKILDSAVIRNGRFGFSGTVDEPIPVHIVVLPEGASMPIVENDNTRFLYLEKGTISIKSKTSISEATISGSALNAEYERYHAAVLKPMKDELKQLQAGFEGRQPDKKMTNTLVNVGRKAMKRQDSLKWAYIGQHPASYLSIVALKELAGKIPDYETIKPAFDKLSAEVRNTNPGRELGKKLEETGRFAAGVVAPDFTQNNVDDQPVKLSDFRGKYVLLDFWASWCGPCRAENPNVVKAYEKYKHKNFTVLGVSLDNPGKKEAWLEAIRKDGLQWTNVSDLQGWKNAVAKLYAINAVPQNFLIGPDGKIIARNLRGEALMKKLAAIMN